MAIIHSVVFIKPGTADEALKIYIQAGNVSDARYQMLKSYKVIDDDIILVRRVTEEKSKSVILNTPVKW